MNAPSIHVFERANLGKAPFRFVGIEDTGEGVDDNGMVWREDKEGFRHGSKPGGSCDYCGNYIVIFCHIRSADGKRFKVGCDCAERTDDRGIVDVVKVALAKVTTAKRHAREETRIAAGRVLLETLRPVLATRPHPRDYLAKTGLTMADWAEWMMKHSGAKGRIEVCKMLEKIAKETP